MRWRLAGPLIAALLATAVPVPKGLTPSIVPRALAADRAFQAPYLSGPVIDEVGLLDAQSVAKIDQALRSFRSQGKMQMVVYIPKSLQGMDIADFSIRLGEAWKLGRKGEDQGLILVIAPNERQMRLEVGYGLEGTLTDAFSRHVLDDVLRPYFRDQRYGDGILAAIGELSRKLGVRAEVPPPGEAPEVSGSAAPALGLLGFLLSPGIFPFVVFLLFLRLVFRRRRRPGLWVSRGGWYGGGWGGGGGYGGGGGGFGGGGASSNW